MKRKVIIACILIFCITAGYAVYKIKNFDVEASNKVCSSGKLIGDVYTDKARYSPKDKVRVTVELNNKLNKAYKGHLEVYFKHLNNVVEKKDFQVTLESKEKKDLAFSWDAPQTDYQGYLVEVYASHGITLDDSKNTAVDISSNWDKFPRYGYLAEYPEQSKEKTESIINNINKFHIDGLQFYDWQNKHQKPLPEEGGNIPNSWKDIANRDIYFQTIKDYIELAHKKNIKAANYNLIYGAYEDYEKDGIKPEWGIYKDTFHSEQDTHPLPESWASSLKVFNPDNKGWQAYIYNQEKQVNKVLGFDIFHMDTLGNRGETFDYTGSYVNLPDTYTEFVDNAKKALGVGVVFNTINRYGLEQVAKSDVDFLYSELWPSDYPNYYYLKETVDKGYQLTNGKKSTVIAAYMNYGSAGIPGEFNEHSVRLTDAAIFAAGGAHIELGDTGMLCREYFPNKNLRMSSSLVAAMRNYYDFLVAYENLLRDGLTDSSNKVELDNVETSDNGAANTVWAYAKEKKGFEVVQMINLLGMNKEAWRDDGANYEAPTIKKDLKLNYKIKNGNIKGIYLASPDLYGGKSVKLNYKARIGKDGTSLQIEIPELQYWDMLYIEKE
ncbi:glycoside hydrolase family 66 protein [Clostridium sp. 19966]|uniref:glycoside hydrolase family 66 protein n=1 Tax=Clostridium sp. 19966 TaxID=2768166 RepID=UPI0028DE42CE|nr:glycoside hydrolase family 66 protein [Clostridium sp. 19966]MDT8717509.1 glycoside hydrolase family 66 protein [Clostridium sp. 19966]